MGCRGDRPMQAGSGQTARARAAATVIWILAAGDWPLAGASPPAAGHGPAGLPHLVLLYSRCLVSAYRRRRIRIRKYVAGRRRHRARCGETEMSEGAGSNDARARISVPRAPGAAKEGAEAT